MIMRTKCVGYRPSVFSVIQHGQLRISTHQPVPEEKKEVGLVPR